MSLQLVERLDRWLEANRPDYYRRLQSGATEAAINAFEARFSIRLPEAFRMFYRWRNGQEATCFLSFQNNFMFSSLEAITETKELLDGMIGFDFEDPRWWRRTWIPFLDNGAGDHLCLDLAAQDGGRPGQLVTFWHDWENRSIKYAGFEAWLSELVDSMESGTIELS